MTRYPGMPGWWATIAVLVLSAGCAVAGLLRWSAVYEDRPKVDG